MGETPWNDAAFGVRRRLTFALTPTLARREREKLWSLHLRHGPRRGGAAQGGQGLVVVHAAGAAERDRLGRNPAEELGAAADREIGVGRVQLADATVRAGPGGHRAGGQEID